MQLQRIKVAPELKQPAIVTMSTSCCEGCLITQRRDKVSEAAQVLGSKHDGSSEQEQMLSTPRAKRHRIPEILSCPPAPMKPRLQSSHRSRSGTRSISFFKHPELEAFFLRALPAISA